MRRNCVFFYFFKNICIKDPTPKGQKENGGEKCAFMLCVKLFTFTKNAGVARPSPPNINIFIFFLLLSWALTYYPKSQILNKYLWTRFSNGWLDVTTSLRYDAATTTTSSIWATCTTFQPTMHEFLSLLLSPLSLELSI